MHSSIRVHGVLFSFGPRFMQIMQIMQAADFCVILGPMSVRSPDWALMIDR